MKGFVFHLAYDIRTGVRDKSLMFFYYLFPLAFFLMAGLFMTEVNPFFSDSMVPGMAVFAVMTAALMSSSSTLISDRQQGIYRSYRVNGVPASSLISLPIIGGITHTAAVTVIMSAAGIMFFGAQIPVNWGWFIITFGITALALFTLGVLIGIVSPSPRSGLLLAQGIYIPSMIVSGMMVPQEMIPENLQWVVSLLPASHGMRAFSSLAMESSPITPSALMPLGVLMASILCNVILCFSLFQWDGKKTEGRRHLTFGLLAFLPFVVSAFL